MAAPLSPATVWSPKGHRGTAEPSPEPGPEPGVQRHVGASRTHDSPEARGSGHAQDSIQLETPGFGTETPDRHRSAFEGRHPGDFGDPLGWFNNGNGYYNCQMNLEESFFEGGGKCDGGFHNMILSDSMPSAYYTFTCNGCHEAYEGSRWYCPHCKDDYCFNCRPKIPKDSLAYSLPPGPPPLPLPNCTIANPLDPSDEVLQAQGESPWAAGASLTSNWSSLSAGSQPVGSSGSHGVRTSSSAGAVGTSSATAPASRSSGPASRRSTSNELNARQQRPTQAFRAGTQASFRRSGGSAGASSSRRGGSSVTGAGCDADTADPSNEMQRQITKLRQETEGKIASMQHEMQLHMKQQMQTEFREMVNLQREWMQRMEDHLQRTAAVAAEERQKGAAEAERRLVDMLLKKKLPLGEGQTPEDFIREILGSDYEGLAISEVESPEPRGRDFNRGSRKSASAPNSSSPGSHNGLHAATLHVTDSPELLPRTLRRMNAGAEHPDLVVLGSPPPFMPTSPPIRLRSDQRSEQRSDQSMELREVMESPSLPHRNLQSTGMRSTNSSVMESPRPQQGVGTLSEHTVLGSPIPSSRTCSPTTFPPSSGAGTPAVKAVQSFEPPQPLRDSIRSSPAEWPADAGVTPRDRNLGPPHMLQPREVKPKKADAHLRLPSASSVLAPSSPVAMGRETRSLSPGSPIVQTLASSVSQRTLGPRVLPLQQIHCTGPPVAYANGLASSVSSVSGNSLVATPGVRHMTPPTGFRTVTRTGYPAPSVPQNWMPPLAKTPHGAPPWGSLPQAAGLS